MVLRRKEMIYNNYPDDYIVINAKWVEWDNDEQRWYFMTEDSFEKAQSLADYTKQVRKEVCNDFKSRFLATCQIEKVCDTASFSLEVLYRILDQLQEDKQ